MAIASSVGCFLVWRQLDRILQVVTVPHFDRQVRRRLLPFGVLHLVYSVGDTLCEYFLWQEAAPEPSSSANGTRAQARRNPEWSPAYFGWLFLWSAPISSLFMLFALLCDSHVAEIESATELLRAGCGTDGPPSGTGSPAAPLEEALCHVWQTSRRASQHLRASSAHCLRALRFPLLLCAGGVISLFVDALVSPGQRQQIEERLWMYPDLAFVVAAAFFGLVHAAARVAGTADRVLLQVNDAGEMTSAVTGGLSNTTIRYSSATLGSISTPSNDSCILDPLPLAEPLSPPIVARAVSHDSPARLLEMLHRERRHIEDLLAYLRTLNMGIEFNEGTRIDYSRIRLWLRLLVTAFVLALQRLLMS